MSAVLYGIDVGTTSLKGIALDESGTVLSRAESGYPLITPERGWAEQNPEDWWSATETVLGKLRTGAALPPGSASPDRCTGLSHSTRPQRSLAPDRRVDPGVAARARRSPVVGSEHARRSAAARGGYSAEFDVSTYFMHDVPDDLVTEMQEHAAGQLDESFDDQSRTFNSL